MTRVRAVAVASDRSNAVGAVELECTPAGLVIVHRGVGAFHRGYAPGALTDGTSVTVPWHLVREASWQDDRLYLHVDESVTPHHRLLLSAFSDDDAVDPRELRRRRLLVRTATLAGTLVAGLLVALTVARLSDGAGAASAILLGLLAAAAVFVVGMVADGRLAGEPQAGEAARVAFGLELTAHLPAVAAPAGRAPASAGRIPLPPFPVLLPRTTTAVVITMSAALLGAVLTASWLAREPRSPSRAAASFDEVEAPAHAPGTLDESAPAARAAAPDPVPAPSPSPSPPPATAPAAASSALLAGVCRCTRADSVLWRDGLPKVSLLLIDRRQRAHKDHVHLELEIGVVNNSDAPIPEVSLLVRFFEKDPPPSKKRVPTFDRPLFFEGPLVAGQAIKWSVEARGNDFEVTGIPP